MWPRKQLDIDWADFAFGFRRALIPSAARHDAIELPPDWMPADEAFVSLSVRTGWDLLLAALRLPPGSEIIMSAVTIPDMACIIEHHRLAPVPIDVDADTLEPDLIDLERSISSRTRAILVAHLFGSRVDMAPLVDIAQRHRLLLVEDCAQAFVGSRYAGHPGSDCSMFSFGPIKTATALGGAVLRVRDSVLRHCMLQIQRQYPVQSRRDYVARMAKYASLHALSNRLAYGALVRGYRALGIDYDRAISSAARSFAHARFVDRIRQRPCGVLLSMLERRFQRFESREANRLHRRAERGGQLARSLPAGMIVGARNPSHTYWALPARVANVAETLFTLRTAGFDATARSSLVTVAHAHNRLPLPGRSAKWLEEAIFLPNGDDMPDAELARMAEVLQSVAQVAPADESCYRRPQPRTAIFPAPTAT